ncbi:hypothetical protein [Tritonibacter scottomollicae]|uniref:hypothetical protein n=1 Tax=Tritonibacter scottomollicae TaxID=483013 RepID=UPI003AA8AE42
MTKTYYAFLGWISFIVFIAAVAVQLSGSDLPSQLTFLKTESAVYHPLIIALLMFDTRILDAPYKRYREEHERRCDLEERRKPRLSVQVTEPNGSDQSTTIVNEPEAWL